MASEDRNSSFTWEQNPGEVILKIDVAADVTKTDVKFKIEPTNITLIVAGVEVCMGALAKEVDPDESSWNFETSNGTRHLVVTLHKVNRTAMKSNREWPSLMAISQ
uniref:CS domain-containing protein n=1 Tax=Noctiluca scintillans TaxID=2966 RepID=A0A7S0ZMI4_NOCSC|mmetsp:Transcript_11153/g.30823  ORF Transcript_11153/g.30823 Transcript_11153/m.30823 type:complete len:106 (+) Transcript_11153:86-403(+)